MIIECFVLDWGGRYGMFKSSFTSHWSNNIKFQIHDSKVYKCCVSGSSESCRAGVMVDSLLMMENRPFIGQCWTFMVTSSSGVDLVRLEVTMLSFSQVFSRESDSRIANVR